MSGREIYRATYEYQGERRVCLFRRSRPWRGSGGLFAGVLTYATGEEVDLAADSSQYAYTHGGEEYRAAAGVCILELERVGRYTLASPTV